MYHFNLFFPPEQMNDFRKISEETSESMAEAIRRMCSSCLNESRLNDLFPQSSGRFLEWRGK